MKTAATDKDYECPKKIAARQATIIEPYRELFGSEVPSDKQYWSMCGKSAHEDGTFKTKSELGQILEAGLIQPSQFHGVEIDEESFQLNKSCRNDVNWYCGDFLETMHIADDNDLFNPGIVNADLVSMPEKSAGYVSDIIKLLSDSTSDVMLVVNVVIRYRYKKSTIDILLDKLNENDIMQSAIRDRQWSYSSNHYPYAGSGTNSNTDMGSIIFFLKG